MNCREFLDNVSPRIDGEAPAEIVEMMEKHEEKCETCRREYEEAERVNGILGSIKETEPSIPAFNYKAAERAGEKTASFFKRPAFALMLLILAIGAVFYMKNLSEVSPVIPVTPAPKTSKPVITAENNRVQFDYRVKMNESDYNIKLEGQDCSLLSVQVVDSDRSELVMAFDEVENPELNNENN